MNLSNLDLNLLLVLHTLLQESSVSRAAKRLNVTSPAISNAMARLRTLLDNPLFVRKGRGIVPLVELQQAMRFDMRLVWHARTHEDFICRVFRDTIINSLRRASNAQAPGSKRRDSASSGRKKAFS